jgi:transcriptional regulator GlxA family with amidase domain
MHERIDRVIRALSRNLGQEWTLVKMAKLADLEPKYFSRLFKQETKMTPSKYLKLARMLEAAERFRDQNSNLSVKEIGYLLGCTDGSHFTKDFKRIHGLTPSAFRRNEVKKFQSEHKLPEIRYLAP